MLQRVKDLYGYTIHATDGDVGHVDDLYFDDDHWTVRYLVVDTGPLFFGRKVLISPVAIESIDWDREALRVDLTQEQVENSPDIDLEKPVSEQELTDLHTYYAWPVFWGGGYWGAPAGAYGVAAGPPYGVAVTQEPNMATAEEEVEETVGEKEWDPSLRSTREVLDYDIQARDGELGEVEDFMLDSERFVLRYMVIDTGGLFDGRHVVISPQWVHRVSWANAEVVVDLTQAEIREAPEYRPGEPISREYETRLHQHYEREGYWA
jgi:sporulation protein YlmC with PRC-barrel domain